jgi:hypothetical protein
MVPSSLILSTRACDQGFKVQQPKMEYFESGTDEFGEDQGLANEPEGVSSFVRTLSAMVSNAELADQIRWNDAGDGILILGAFSRGALPRYFTHSNIRSFVRQLNLYGFRRRGRGLRVLEFFHPRFHRDRVEERALISRRHPRTAGEADVPGSDANVPAALAEMRASLHMRIDGLAARVEQLEQLVRERLDRPGCQMPTCAGGAWPQMSSWPSPVQPMCASAYGTGSPLTNVHANVHAACYPGGSGFPPTADGCGGCYPAMMVQPGAYPVSLRQQVQAQVQAQGQTQSPTSYAGQHTVPSAQCFMMGGGRPYAAGDYNCPGAWEPQQYGAGGGAEAAATSLMPPPPLERDASGAWQKSQPSQLLQPPQQPPQPHSHPQQQQPQPQQQQPQPQQPQPQPQQPQQQQQQHH